jgi:hypothetical protein
LKRNVPPVLCGLIEGKHIVTEEFIDAVAAACSTVTDVDNSDILTNSLLEQDFETNWPVELGYLPLPGKEPVTRGPEWFAPNPQRANVFEGYIFIFADQNQFDQLQAPITLGTGKALIYPNFQVGVTRFKDFVAFVKSHSPGGKWVPGEGKGPVVVRYTPKVPDEWVTDFVHQTDLALGQRSIVQNEFLDAILTNNATSLRRPLQEVIEIVVPSGTQGNAVPAVVKSSMTFSAHHRPSVRFPPQEQEVRREQPQRDAATTAITAPPSTAPPRRTRRAITESRFKGFDDSDDDTPTIPPPRTTTARNDEDQEVNLDDTMTTAISASSKRPTLQPRNPRKRPAPPTDVEISSDDENMRMDVDAPREAVDNLLPATSAMRRRRTEAVRGEGGKVGVVAKTKSPEEVAREREKVRLERARKKRDRKAEVDVAEEIRKRREREIREREMEEERVREGLEGLDVRGLKGLVQIEEMGVPVKVLQEVQQEDVVEGQSERAWKEEWNGRKNFKGFRRKGDAQGQQRTRKIIVKLEEVKKKAYGIGEEYWVTESVRSGSRKSQESQSQRRSQGTSQHVSNRVPERDEEIEEDEWDDSRFRRSTKNRKPVVASMDDPDVGIINIRDQDQEDLPETFIATSMAGSGRRDERSLRSHVVETQVQDAATPETQRKTRAGKRIAQDPPTASTEPPMKKGRAGKKRVEVEEDSDDEDGLKFRRRKKK